MRTIQIILSFLAISCVVQAQEALPFLDRKVTHNFNDLSIGEVLKELEGMNKGLVFVYSSSTFDMERKVSGDFKGNKLNEVLEKVFEGEQVEFQEKKSKIIIRQKKKKAKNNTQSQPTVEAESTERTHSPKRRRRLVRNTQPDTVVDAREVSQVSQKEPIESVKQEDQEEAESLFIAEAPITRVDTVSKVDNYRSIASPEWKIPQYRIPNNFKLTETDSSLLESKEIKKALAKIKREKARLERQEERLNEEKKFRVYGSSYTGFTQVGGSGGIQLGGSLVWLKNKRWGFGLAGYAVQNSLQNDAVLSTDYRLAGGYGGLFMEYTLNPSKRIHFSFPLTIGGGGIAYKQDIDRSLNLAERIIEDSKAFFAVETAANVEVNLIKYLRVGLGIGYRYTTSTTLTYQENPGEITGASALSGFNFGLTVKVGIF